MAPDSGPAWVVSCPTAGAKRVKDALKACRLLDDGRQVERAAGGADVLFPLAALPESFAGGELPDAAAQAALLAVGAKVVAATAPPPPRSAAAAATPKAAMAAAVRLLLAARDVPADEAAALLADLPQRWERLGDVALLPAHALRHAGWEARRLLPDALPAVAAALGVRRLARQAEVDSGPKRESRAAMLWPPGAGGWTEARENGVAYGLDVTRVMYSSGNGTEKARMAALRAAGETVLDAYAGIGYWTLQLLVHAGAARVIACEWNPHSLAALRANLAANGVAERCTVLEGDNRETAPRGVAHRVLLGLLPSSRDGWPLALRALRDDGGWLHVHGNVRARAVRAWAAETAAELEALAAAEGRGAWRCRVAHVEVVKSYAPHVVHAVADIHCAPQPQQPQQRAATAAVTEASGSCGEAAVVATLVRPDAKALMGGPAAQRVPALLTGLDVGAAVERWDAAYLALHPEAQAAQVAVHVSATPALDFVSKNFRFQNMTLAQLVTLASAEQSDNNGCFYYYLRSVGANPRREPANFAASFPELARDVAVPPLFPPDAFFSSVLRVASPGTSLWTHYDCADNVLIQLRGHKRVLLFRPQDVDRLYMEGSSSAVVDVDDLAQPRFPRFAAARRRAAEVRLGPGDALFIPALWPHHATALRGGGLSVAVNVFWRRLPAELTPDKDLYGNRDPCAAEAAAAAVERALRELGTLPADGTRQFYTRMLIGRLQAELELQGD